MYLVIKKDFPNNEVISDGTELQCNDLCKILNNDKTLKGVYFVEKASVEYVNRQNMFTQSSQV